MSTTRVLALDALVRIEDGAYANLLLPELLRRRDLEARDRAFVTDLVYSTVRQQRALDFVLARFSSRPLHKLDAPVRAALRLGAFQLGAGMAAHAAVGETVEAAPERARGFVNGTLRSLARAGPPWPLPEGDDAASIGIRTSHPDWIVETFIRELGTEAALATLELDNQPPPVTLRVNGTRTTPPRAIAQLEGLGVEVEQSTVVPDSLLVRHTGDLAAVPLVRDGALVVQEQASTAVVAALDPQPGEHVLDVAAAPGGKSITAAGRMTQDGLVVAADVHAARVRMMARTFERVGARRAVPVVADGRHLPFGDQRFDRVLVDAPCSGLGVLRRRPDARWRVQPHDVDDLAALQRELLVEAARVVRPGGRLVYSVCTITAAETEGVDAFAADELPDLVACEPPWPTGGAWRARGRGTLLVPSAAGTDGMFVLVLERSR